MELPFSSPPQYEPAVTTDAPGEAHWFERFSDDFAVWVLFYGPEGGEK